MPLLNYTTTVPSVKTAAEIQELLGRGGASEVSMRYAGGQVVAIRFRLAGPLGEQEYSLPVDPAPVLAMLRRECEPRYRNPEQAERTAWRITKDWVEAQLAMVATAMVSLDQVMLPYLQVAPGGSFYDHVVERGLRQLEAPR